MKKDLLIGALVGAIALAYVPTTAAQVAGTTTTVGVSVTESVELAMGWSVKKTLLGKTVYNELGDKVGKVEDLIIAPSRTLSYLIIGAGGFVGIGRHDVAIPVSQIENQAGKLVMTGATKDAIKALPGFAYADKSAMREQYLSAASAKLTKAKADIDVLQSKASAAKGDAQQALEAQITPLLADLKAAEGKLSELKDAESKRWKDHEAGVNAALARLRKAIDNVKR